MVVKIVIVLFRGLIDLFIILQAEFLQYLTCYAKGNVKMRQCIQIVQLKTTFLTLS